MNKIFSFRKILAILTAGGILLFSHTGFADKGKEKVPPGISSPEGKAVKVPDVIATVNGVKIKGDDFSKSLESYKRRLTMMGQQLTEENEKEINKGIIDDMVSRELLTQNTNKMKIKISDDELNKEIETLKLKFHTEEQFNQAIKSQNMTLEDVKKDIRKVMAIKKLIKSEIEDKVSIDEKEVTEYYNNNPSRFLEDESVKASHILVKVDKNASKEEKDAARKKIDGLLKKTKKGEDFAKLAKENSDDPGSGQNGGDLGFFSKGMMVPPFEKAVFSLKKDEVSDVVETEFGYHIIKLTDKKSARNIPLTEVHDKLKGFLKSIEVNKKLSEYIANLKKTADVKITEF